MQLVNNDSKYHKLIINLFTLSILGIAISLPISPIATDVFFILSTLLALFQSSPATSVSRIIHNKMSAIFLVFFFMFIIGVTYSTAPMHNILIAIKKYDKFLFAAIMLPFLDIPKISKYAINSFLIATNFVLLLSILKAHGIIHLPGSYGPASIFESHIQTGFYFAISAYLFFQKAASTNMWSHRILFIILSILFIYDVLLLCQGRSGYFVLAALAILFAYQHFSWKGILIATILTILTLLGAYTISPSFKDRMQAIHHDVAVYQHNDRTSVGLRMRFLHNTIIVIRKHPLFGTGTGSFATEYTKIKPTPKILTVNPHNEYLNITTQFGITGLIILLTMFILQWCYSYTLPKDLRHLAQGTVVAIAVGCLANSWLMDTTEGHLFVFFIALAFAGLNYNNSEHISSND